MSSESLHEDAGKLGPEVIDQHRAIVSLMEELEAVDWYNQRAKATSNPELRAILEHNRDEEKEHAAMALEWLRRSDPTLSQHLKTFLFTAGPDHRHRGDHGQSRRRRRRRRTKWRRQPRHRQPAISKASGQAGGREMKNHLFRDRAPITEAGWEEIEKEAKRTLRGMLAGRRVVDFRGPLGWDDSDVELGRADPISSPASGPDVQARLRRVQPLVELRIPFEVTRAELDAIDRGARDPDLDSVIAAARQIAIAEDRAIFHGYKAAHITGICEAAASTAVPLGSSHADYPGAVSAALTKLRDEGIEGPFAVVLNEQLYKDLAARTDSGYPILSHVQRLVDGDIVWAAGLDGGLVLSKRGGDFELTVGQDFSIGYLEHNLERVRLYIEESFTFLVLTDQAAVPLTVGGGKKG